MGKPLEISDMPPLTPEMHDDLRGLENRLQLALSKCCSGYDLIDSHAAFEYVRTYATEFFDCFYRFYSGIRDEKYRPHWRPASETFAFDRVVHCIENSYAVLGYFRSEAARVERIKRTINDHADSHTIEKILPLMLPPNRQSVFVPVIAVPRKRIGRSIESKRAAQRMEAYIEEKGLTQTQFSQAVDADQKTLYRFRRFGKVDKSVAKRIADVMGITLEKFLS